MVTRRTQTRLLAGILSFLLFVVVMILMCRVMGDVAGEEISPETFERRSFRYYEIPLFHIQVYPIRRTSSRHELAEWIQGQSLLPPTSEKSWDLTQVERNGGLIAKGDARILATYFDSEDANGKPLWLTWSKAHPKLAAVLWPRISQVAQDGLYIFIPKLMEEALRAKKAIELNQRLTASLVDQYRSYAAKHTRIGDHASSMAALTEAIKLDQKNPDLLEARADSLEQLSKPSAAKADRDRAQELRKAESN